MTDDRKADLSEQACGCRDDGEVIHACRTHWIAGAFGFFHANMEGHEECCDKGQMEKLIADYGVEDVRGAIGVSRPAWRDYLTRVLEMAS